MGGARLQLAKDIIPWRNIRGVSEWVLHIRYYIRAWAFKSSQPHNADSWRSE